MHAYQSWHVMASTNHPTIKWITAPLKLHMTRALKTSSPPCLSNHHIDQRTPTLKCLHSSAMVISRTENSLHHQMQMQMQMYTCTAHRAITSSSKCKSLKSGASFSTPREEKAKRRVSKYPEWLKSHSIHSTIFSSPVPCHCHSLIATALHPYFGIRAKTHLIS